MNIKKLLAVALASAMTLSAMALPSSAATVTTDANGYGTSTLNDDGSTTLNFGDSSVTSAGGGYIVTDDANGGVKRPDNLKADAVLTMPEIDLSATNYNKVELYAASSNSAAVAINVGDTTVASFADVKNGSWTSYSKNVADLTSTTASGNVTVNITGSGYCGNYVYVRFYYEAPTETVTLDASFDASAGTAASYDLIALAKAAGADADALAASEKITVGYDLDVTAAFSGGNNYVDLTSSAAGTSCNTDADSTRYGLFRLNQFWNQLDMVDCSQGFSGSSNTPGQWLNCVGKFDYSTKSHVTVTIDSKNKVVSATGTGSGDYQDYKEYAFASYPADAAAGSLYLNVYPSADAYTISNITVTYNAAVSTEETPEPTTAPEPVDLVADFTGEGLLTADEVSAKSAVSFGIDASGARVAVDSADAVMVVGGNYHSNHGLTHFTSTVTVSGPALITAGTCAWGGDLIVKDASGAEVAKVNTNNGTCFHGDKENNVVSTYYKGEATTLTISGGNYLPYIAVKEVDASEIPNDVTATFDISAYAACEGTAPANITVDMGETITIPANTSLYFDGMTLKGWTDSVTTYAVGDTVTLTKNITLAPVFEENTVALGDADATVNFTFRRDQGAITYSSQGGSAVIVAQADVNGTKIDVKVDVDTSNGKFANGNWNDWAQVNGGTKFIVPVVKGSVITMGDLFSDNGEYTIGGEALVGDGGTYTATEAGTVEIVAGATSGSYWRGFTVTYPKAEVAPAVYNGIIAKINSWSGEGYEGEATALTATFTVEADQSFDTVTVTPVANADKAVTKTVTTVTGGSAVYGIVVNALVEADALTATATLAE